MISGTLSFLDPAIPRSIQEKIILPLLAQALSFLVASSTLVPEQQQTVARAVREGGSLQTVTTARIIQELRLKSYILRDSTLRSRTELYSRSEINLHLIVTETHLFLALPGSTELTTSRTSFSARTRRPWSGANCSSSTSRAAPRR